MKRLFMTLLIAILVCGLTSCSGERGAGNSPVEEIDAATEAEKTVTPCFALKTSNGESDIWTSDRLAAFDRFVYYIGSDSNKYYVNCFDCETAANMELLSSADKLYCDISVDLDGVVYVLAASANEDGNYEVIMLDTLGNTVESYPFGKLDTADGWLPSQLEVYGGKLFIIGNEQLVSAEIESGIKVLQTVQVQSGAKLARTHDGEILLAYNRENNYRIDVYSPLEENLSPADSVAFNIPFTDVSGGAVWDAYLSSSNALFGYRFDTKELKKLFSWNGIGIIQGSVAEAKGKLVCAGRISYDKPSPPLILVPIEVSAENSGVIRFATTDPNGIDFRVQEAIRAWNGSHPDCPIEIVDYSVYGGGNSTLSATKLMADVVAGNMPDIYDFSMTSVDTIPSSAQLARRGLLENIYPYIDSDPELARADFVPGVINSLEINSGLYEVVPAFSIVTTIASSNAVGSEENWTYDALNSVVKSSDFFDTVFDNHHDRMWLLGNIVDASGEKLVDWSAGKCYFESDYFRNVLETVKQMPETGEQMESAVLSDEVSTSTGLLYYINANDVWMASTAPQAFFEDYCFPGLPEVGSAVYPLLSYGISAYSENKNLCWQFLRQFLTEEYKMKFFISPRMDGLREQVSSTWEGFIDIRQYHPYGLEAMNKLADIIIDADTVVRHDAQIWQVVHAAAGAYFAGDQSVEDTMKQIQSRVSIYLAEQYG